jgi:hypothetical protein
MFFQKGFPDSNLRSIKMFCPAIFGQNKSGNRNVSSLLHFGCFIGNRVYPGICILPKPIYSPNLNIIERLWKFTKKKILYAKYYETPTLFHNTINAFFRTINQEYNDDLKNLLTLKFQFFENQSAEIYPK